MIEEFTKRYFAKLPELREKFAAKYPEDYIDVVRAVVEILRDEDSYGSIDPTRIHQIDDGDYQGTLVFVIAANGYPPSDYWYCRVYYGSCSGCDTLQAIRGYRDDTPSDDEVSQYMTLAMHVVQGLRQMGGEAA